MKKHTDNKPEDMSELPVSFTTVNDRIEVIRIRQRGEKRCKCDILMDGEVAASNIPESNLGRVLLTKMKLARSIPVQPVIKSFIPSYPLPPVKHWPYVPCEPKNRLFA